MKRKWVPDFVRVVEDFAFTQTQKVLVRNHKKVHFERNRLPDEPIYWRQRGDKTRPSAPSRRPTTRPCARSSRSARSGRCSTAEQGLPVT
jgi:hypothetical protein